MRGRRALISGVGAMGLGLLLGRIAEGRLIDFNNPNDLSNNFRQTSSPSVYSTNTTDGIGGSGSVRGGTNIGTMVLNNGETFNFAAPDARVTVSSYVRLQTQTATGGSTLDLGLAQGQFSTFSPPGASNQPWVLVRLSPTSAAPGFTLTSS